jgi:hypothetical protein
MVATISHSLLLDLRANDPSLSDKILLLILTSRAFGAIYDACLGLLLWQPIGASKLKSFELKVSFISKLKFASLKPLISIPRLIVIVVKKTFANYPFHLWGDYCIESMARPIGFRSSIVEAKTMEPYIRSS